MRARVLLGVILLAVGVAVPLLAIAVWGSPWGYRGAPAVLTEVTGDVEISRGSASAAQGGTGALAAAPGMKLQAGDVLRVARFSEAKLRSPATAVTLKDGARLVVGDRLSLGRGTIEVTVAAGQRAAQIDVEGAAPGRPDAQISVQPGRTLVTADGRGTCVVVVLEGSAQATSATGGESAEPGQALLLERGQPPKVQPSSGKIELAAACESAPVKQILGSAAPATQVYLNGRMDYAGADGRFVMPWPTGAVEGILFARDPVGNTDRKLVVCP